MDCAALYKREIRLERLKIIELRSNLIQKAEFRTFINYPNLWVSLLSIPDYRNLSQKAISVLVRLPTRVVKRLYGARGKKQVWRPHGRSLAPLWSNLSFFEGKFTVLKKALVTLLGLFVASSSDSAPPRGIGARRIVPPCPPRYAPAANNLLLRARIFCLCQNGIKKRNSTKDVDLEK